MATIVMKLNCAFLIVYVLAGTVLCNIAYFGYLLKNEPHARKLKYVSRYTPAHYLQDIIYRYEWPSNLRQGLEEHRS